jgi:predicted secreted Zn-dependent protease
VISSEDGALWWRKATASGTGNCVEAAATGGEILVRNSRNPLGSPISFTLTEWECFLDGVKKGEFDKLSE